MNRIANRTLSLGPLGIGAFVLLAACASEEGAFTGLLPDSSVAPGGGASGVGGLSGSGGGAPGGGFTGSAGFTGGAGDTGAGGTLPSGGSTGSGGSGPGGGASGASASGGAGSTCKPSFCPSTGSGSPCCTSSGACGVDFGMGCAPAPRDGGTASGGSPSTGAGGSP